MAIKRQQGKGVMLFKDLSTVIFSVRIYYLFQKFWTSGGSTIRCIELSLGWQLMFSWRIVRFRTPSGFFFVMLFGRLVWVLSHSGVAEYYRVDEFAREDCIEIGMCRYAAVLLRSSAGSLDHTRRLNNQNLWFLLILLIHSGTCEVLWATCS